MNAKAASNALRKLADPKAARFLARYFKTEPGGYGEGDTFLGIKVPLTRKVARQFVDLPLEQCARLLSSRFHEERLLALLVLVAKFRKAKAESERRRIYALYIKSLRHINNWDLVDTSAPFIIGPYLVSKSRDPLYRLARSKDVWKRRVAIMSTFHFIRNNDHEDTLQIATLLLRDPHDLIRKAVGWMLREVGNRNRAVEERFLLEHYRSMPRTMLRYAIEKFPRERRLGFLKGTAK